MDKLIKKCKQYDRHAQREMVNHLSSMMYAICLRYSNNNIESAKDLVQESLIKVFNNINKCQAKTLIQFKAWAKTITINTALAEIRKNKLIVEDLEVVSNSLECSATILDNLNAKEIIAYLNDLPLKHKTVFNLFVIDGYSHKEIGEILNIKESSSRTFLVRAREALKKVLLSENSSLKMINL